MPSTLSLKITYIVHLISIVLMPILGILTALLLQVLVVIFSLGNEETTGIGNEFILAGFILGLTYLIILIGLIKKSNFSRLISILLNFIIAIFATLGTISAVIDGNDFTDILVLTVFTIVYYIPVYSLAIHSKTKDLF